MAEQSFLTKLGLRFGAVGSSVALGLAAPVADANYSTAAGTATNRSGAFFDQTAAAEKISYVVGGQTGPFYTRSGTVVNANYNGKFGIPSGVNPTINGAVLTQRFVVFETIGVFRWNMFANNNAEPGGNAGSGPIWQAYSDAGAALDQVMSYGRATGNGMQFTRPVVFSTGVFFLSSNVATTRSTNFATTALGNRWQESTTNGAESGANAGSGWNVAAYTDTGVVINSPFQVVRAALGIILWVRPANLTVGTLTGVQTAYSASATWNNAASTFIGWIINPANSASNGSSRVIDLQVGGVSRFNVGVGLSGAGSGILTMSAVDTDLMTTAMCAISRTTTLTAGVADGYMYAMNTLAVNGLFTVARENWLSLDNPTGSATVTDACALAFDAAAGTHCCIDAGSIKTTPTGVGAWAVMNVNGTLYYAPIYTSKTS